jgi:hypothetical protein
MIFQLAVSDVSATTPLATHMSPTTIKNPGLDGRRPTWPSGFESRASPVFWTGRAFGVTRPWCFRRLAIGRNRSVDHDG